MDEKKLMVEAFGFGRKLTVELLIDLELDQHQQGHVFCVGLFLYCWCSTMDVKYVMWPMPRLEV